MVENMFYQMLLDQESLENFLVTHGLVVNAATADEKGHKKKTRAHLVDAIEKHGGHVKCKNRGSLLRDDETIIQEDRDEWLRMNNNQPMHPNRNYGMRISGPWIIGLMECIKDNQGQYKSDEVGLFKVERRDSATLLPLTRSHVHTGSTIWFDQWAAYDSLNREG
ncbi:hypothetical protein RF11_08818 [Thelohanellus kitauei]|uniref:Uncharacterized protein n=1 Tax=Thelohanellus kitauei TaxID=669202 RepID=A0A0C2MQS5_THEKT|nr:hypothetical protein RF11_08818 [Thelohanellus kitauei]